MVRRMTAGVGAFLACGLSAAAPQSILEQIEKDVAGVVKQARGGVTAIEDERLALGKESTPNAIPGAKPAAGLKGLKRFPVPEHAPSAAPAFAQPKSGTGFCVAEGYIVTTADVLEGMHNPIVVTDSGARYRARIVKIDPELNIGLLLLPDKSGVPPLPMGDSAAIAAGHFAITIGNQGGHINSVSLATIASTRTEGTFSGNRFYPRLIQIAGTVGAGSSGSPLLNAKGQVIGMLAAAPAAEMAETTTKDKGESPVDGSAKQNRATVTSAGFAIPINDLKPVIDEMRVAKMYARAWIGVDLREESRVEPDPLIVRVRRALRIEGVYPDSPAAKAGLRKGDLISRMNGRDIRSLGDFRTIIVGLRRGAPLRIEVIRDGKPVEAVVPFEMRPPAPKPGD